MALSKNKIKQIRNENRNMFAETSKNRTSYYEDHNLRPYNPDDLWQQKGNYDLYDEMREDDQIAALLHLKKLIILDNKWDIISENEEVRSFLIKVLEGVNRGLDKKIYDILSSLDYGFSLSEKVWKVEDKMIVLDDILTRPPHSWTFYDDTNGKVDYIEQYFDEGDITFKKSDFHKLIHYVNQMEFDDPYGRSELNKGVYTDWWSKSNIIRFWNIYLERHGMPVVHGTYPQKYGDQKDELKKVLKNLQAKTSITTPDEVKINLLEVSGDGSGYKVAIDYYNTAIARKMLIPDLLGYSGETIGGGSYALGREHFGIFYTVIEQVRNEIERVMQLEIIEPLLKWNFAGKEEATFEFQKVDDNRRENNLKMWMEWVKNGGVVTEEASDWFHQNIEAPAPERGAPDAGLIVKEKPSLFEEEQFTAKSRVILVGGPRRGKSTTSRALRAKGIPTYCTDPKSLCKEPEDGVTYLPEKYAKKGAWSDGSKYIAEHWFTMPGPWCIEGVATARSLRKWYKKYYSAPCDKVLVYKEAHPLAIVSQGQENMAKGVNKVWKEVAPKMAAVTVYK